METAILNRSALRRKVIIKFVIFSLGILLNFSGYMALLNLQSSINIEYGVGAASLTATYITATLVGVTFTPVIIRVLGSKACVLLCEFTYLVYILVNYYPKAYTLIPAGVIVGIGEATLWPFMMLFCVYYGRCFARYCSKDANVYVVDFIGVFYFIFQLSAVFGNLLGYAILYGGKSPIPPGNASTLPTPTIQDLSMCGRNDCQDPNITIQNINSYVPASQTLLYILIGVMASLVLSAMFVHSCFVTNIDINDNMDENIKLQKTGIEEASTDKPSIAQTVFSTLKQTGLHLINPKQLLITPFAIYTGFVMAFGFLEATRAFGSCVIGVEYVGLFSALMGVADAFMSYMSCKISSKTGRHVPMLMGICLDIANYVLMLCWMPTESSAWLVYVIFILIGLVDGTWQPLVNELHSNYFPGSEDIALAVWNMYVIVGLAWQTGWSTSLCVYQKVYFQIAFLGFSVICYGISQRVYYSTKSNHTNENPIELPRATESLKE